MRKYSDNFNNSYEFYLHNIDKLTFSGSLPKWKTTYDEKGVDAKRAFHILESQGKIVPTRELELFNKLIKTKESVNFHIKLWAEGRNDATLTSFDLNEMIEEYKLPDWVLQAITNQSYKLYKNEKKD